MSPSQKAVGYADVVGAVCNSFATTILIGPLKDKFGWIPDFFG